MSQEPNQESPLIPRNQAFNQQITYRRNKEKLFTNQNTSSVITSYVLMIGISDTHTVGAINAINSLTVRTHLCCPDNLSDYCTFQRLAGSAHHS